MNIKIYHITILIATLIAPFAMGEEKPAAHQDRDEAMRNMEVELKGVSLNEQRSKVGFEHEMRQLELQRKRFEVEREKRSLQEPENPPRGSWGPEPGGPGRGGPGCPMPGKPGCPGPLCPVFMLFCLVVNVLLAFWVSRDIQQRKMGSRIWIAIALLTGLFGMFVYALVRIGDRPV